jgi:hypothetical protein
VTTFGTSAKMQPPPAWSRAFDATCSAWLGRRVDTIPLGLHKLLFDFLLLQLLLIDGRTKGALFDSLNVNGFGPDCRTGSRFGLSPAKQVCSAATTWTPSPTAAADEDSVLRDSRRRSVCGHHRRFHVSCRLAVSEARLALPNFYKITIRVANVAARLAVLFLWLCDKLRSSISP